MGSIYKEELNNTKKAIASFEELNKRYPLHKYSMNTYYILYRSFLIEKNQEKVGKTFKVLIDKKEAGRYLARTEFDSVEVDNEVVINTNKKLIIGDFVQVKITKAYDYDIEGEIV